MHLTSQRIIKPQVGGCGWSVLIFGFVVLNSILSVNELSSRSCQCVNCQVPMTVLIQTSFLIIDKLQVCQLAQKVAVVNVSIVKSP